MKPEPIREQLAGANECLDMVRAALERLGLPMQGCAPMFYDDAIRQLASILGRKAGFATWLDVQRYVAEYQAEREERTAVPAPPAVGP